MRDKPLYCGLNCKNVSCEKNKLNIPVDNFDHEISYTLIMGLWCKGWINGED
jgi:hypothetical protein